jgi:hypothetical protein
MYEKALINELVFLPQAKRNREGCMSPVFMQMGWLVAEYQTWGDMRYLQNHNPKKCRGKSKSPPYKAG